MSTATPISLNDIIEDVKNTSLPLLPLKDVIILPKSILPIIVGRPVSIQAVEHALSSSEKCIFISTQKDSTVEEPKVEDVYQFGTLATILQVMRMPNGSLKILVEGLQRAKIIQNAGTDGYLSVFVEEFKTVPTPLTVELEGLWRHLKKLYGTYAQLNDQAPANLMEMAKTPEDMDTITDTIAVHIKDLSSEHRQEILEAHNLNNRISLLSSLLSHEIEILKTEKRIKGHVQTQVEKNQREYYLTEQIKAIQKELGREDQQVEISEIREKIKKLGLSEEATEKVEKELRRLEQMPPLSSEAVVCRHYIDWMISIPWQRESKDTISISQAEKILNTHHAGLQKAKERIIEFLAAKKFSKELRRSPILCLVGPPGVGKTSLAQSVAESLKREFVRISLGGIRDEAEIRGHRRTYIGALPGKIIQAMRKAKTVNPVILLDEIDKISRDIHGDPASALLEVLDPEQNKNFTDHFLDIEYDLSKVMFIATANMYEGIPYPLLDRMEIISLSGYTDEEKITIARKFLIPKGLKEHSLDAKQFVLPDSLLPFIVSHYTKEAGVRQLERVIAKLMRKSIQVLLKDKGQKRITVDEPRIREWLGYPKYKPTSRDQQRSRIGLATGLAWTEVGGDILEIETMVIAGKGNVQLTGQLGEVMQESAHAALSYIRSRATELGLNASFSSTKDIHIHIPEGATPKDGPSAGITMCTALISALTKTPTRADVAMTGEITLRGRVLSVGGLKEKLLAAQQQNFKTVIVPKENFDDIQEIKKEVDLKLELVYVDHMDEVLKTAFEKLPRAQKKAVKKQKKKAKASSKE
jgi:ATP-dependent Lon protease